MTDFFFAIRISIDRSNYDLSCCIVMVHERPRTYWMMSFFFLDRSTLLSSPFLPLESLVRTATSVIWPNRHKRCVFVPKYGHDTKHNFVYIWNIAFCLFSTPYVFIACFYSSYSDKTRQTHTHTHTRIPGYSAICRLIRSAVYSSRRLNIEKNK